MAGIHPITLIKEPEAAALYTLHVLQEKALSVSKRSFVLWIRILNSSHRSAMPLFFATLAAAQLI